MYYGLRDSKDVDIGVVAVDAVSDGDGIADEGDKIIKIISTLNTIKLDTDFFQDKSFLSLDDLFVHLVEGGMGKSNPFSNY